MAKLFDAEEVAKHTSPESCWVILYGNVYDVTDFLPSHPGGSQVILRLAGRDATEEYDPVHPPGTLEENLKPEAKLGRVNPDSLLRAKKAGAEAGGATDLKGQQQQQQGKTSQKEEEKYVAPPMESLLNAHDIEEAATRQISKRAWAYYYSAGDDLLTKEYNNAVYRSILLRPRIFVDVAKVDTATTLLGHPVGTPLYVSPAAMARLAHPDGERGIARGISCFGAAQLVSNNASMTPEQIVEGAEPGQVFGWQLYVQNDRRRSEAMLKRIAALSQWFKFVVLTLDAPWPGKREHDERLQWAGFTTAAGGAGGAATAASSGTGGTSTADFGLTAAGKPLGSSGSVAKALFSGTASDLTWATTLDWLAQHTSLPIVLKGVQTHEDAYLAMRHADKGVKAIILSNHGGRALDTAPPAVHTLLEIRKYCPEVLSRLEVWVDGGVKRGTDVVKALCLGAKGVGIGRLPLYGLGAGGAKGVERVFEIFQAEIETCMRLLGAKTVADLGPRFVNTRAVERDIFDGDAGLESMGLWAQAKL